MTAYYNENDKQTCAWLRELIKQDLIAPGDVDERDIKDVRSDDLVQFQQIHLFAGIGVWSYALRQAGWPDDRPVLTGSCPCTPFSSAGKKEGTKSKAHLWPEMFRLIAGLPESKRPPTIFGEQVAQKAGQAWFDAVQADLARENYAAGLVVFPACFVGAPHLRQRLYWFADDWVADSDGKRSQRHGQKSEQQQHAQGRQIASGYSAESCDTHGVEQSNRLNRRAIQKSGQAARGKCRKSTGNISDTDGAGPINGYWRNADWLWCRDEKWRPTEPGLEPLVDGSAARVVRLRGFGNAIVAPQAQAFIESYLEDERMSIELTDEQMAKLTNNPPKTIQVFDRETGNDFEVKEITVHDWGLEIDIEVYRMD